jgi:hypothetical protein
MFGLVEAAGAAPIRIAAAYAPPMSAFYLPAALVLIAVACLLMGLFGAESRPGFVDGLLGMKERWFPHSKID